MIRKLLYSAIIMALGATALAQVNGSIPLANGCDTINYPAPNIWGGRGLLTYQINPTGYVTGTNGYNDKEVAHFFDQSGSGNNYLTRVWIYFGRVDASAASKAVVIKVYDGTSNSPGAILGSVNTTLGDLYIDFLLNDRSDFRFTPAIALPASKKFFIAVDFSALTWSTDTLAVNSSLSGRTAALTWVKQNANTWYNLGGDGLALSLFMHPFVSPTTTCEITAPVQMEPLQGKATKLGNELNWKTQTELQNKGFDILYSTDGSQFEPIGFVPSTAKNGSSNYRLSYTFVHQPLTNGDKAWYRLRQIDLNGDSHMSNVVVLQTVGTQNMQGMRIAPNPIKGGQARIQWQQPTQQGDWLRLTDIQGKTIKQIAIGTASLQSSLQLQGVQAGMYYLQLMNQQGVVIAEKCWID